MKRFFALAALVLGLAACQTEPEGLDVNMGGDVATISVVLPEDAITRAGGTDSAASGLDNTDKIVRVVMHIYDEAGRVSNNRYVDYLEGDARTVNFDIRLVPDRQYTFVAWADQVDKKEDEDKYFNTKSEYGLAYVTPMSGTWTAMNEERDAFTATHTEANFTSASNITLKLIRPFAKLRVVTTDMEFLNDLDVQPTTAKVSYATKHYNAFNAVTGVAINKENTGVEHEYTIASYGEGWRNGADMTLFTDYFFAADDQEEVVNFTLKVYDQDGVIIGKETNFNTPIPVKRNNLTTIAGNILTEGNDITVTVEEDFAQPELEMDELSRVAMFEGGKYTLTKDVVLTSPLVVKQNMVLNLNGKTITTTEEQTGRHHYAIDNYGTLTLEGEGAINARGIKNFGTMTINGNITITNVDTNGGAAIWNEGDLTINNGTFKTNDSAGEGSYGAALNTRANGKAVVNGGTFEAYSQLTYAVINEGETVINNATVKGKHGAVASASGAAYKTTINGGSFELMENPGVSDHCVYYVSAIYGGTFSLGNNTDSGAKVFYESNIADGYKAVKSGDKYMVVKEDVGGVATDNATLDTAIRNAQDGDTIALNAGEYVIPDSAVGKTITFVGTGAPEDTLITAQNDGAAEGNCDYSLRGSKATFENVTITTTGTYFPGYAGCQGTYKNCIINGTYTLYGDSVFEDCTLNVSGDVYNIWTWGAKNISFERCTFNSDGKALLLYQEGTNTIKLNVATCTFNDNGALADLKAAIEIGDAPYGATPTYYVNVSDTKVNGYEINDNGIYTGTTLWANKNSMPAERLIVTVDGYTWVADGLSQKDGEYYVSNANGLNYFSNVTAANGTVIKLAADIDMNGAEFKAIAAGYDKSLTFDGQNHTIKNVKIATCSHNTVNSAGLFFCYTGGTLNVSNLVVEKATSVGATHAGVITGYTQGNATLTNITVKECNISGVKKIGGISGFVEASTTNFVAENCKVIDTTVAATEKQAGTIIGYNAKPATLKNCTVENSTATAPQYCDGDVRCTDPAQAELTIE